MKKRTTNSLVPLYGSLVGFVLGILISAVFVFSYLPEISSVLLWGTFFGFFTGPLGAVVGAYLAAYWLMADREREKLTRSLIPIFGGVVGYILGFWIPGATIFFSLIQETAENIPLAIMYAPCAGFLAGPFGAVSGVYLGKYLLKRWVKEENFNSA